MRKILIVTNIFSPAIGGPAQFVGEFAEYLRKKGYRVTVFCNTQAKAGYDNSLTFRVIRPCLKNKYLNFIRLHLFLFLQILRHKKIFVAGLEMETYKYCSFLKKSYIIKVVSDPVWEIARNKGKTLLDVLEFQKDQESIDAFSSERNQWLKAIHYSKKIITPGIYVKNLVSFWITEKEKIKVISNSTDLTVCDGHSPKSRKSGEVLKILFIGRLTNLKGLETLSLAIVDIENIHLSICGDGPEFVQIFELNRQLQNKNVEFLGRLSKTEIYERLESNHLLVLPSITEGLSHTLIDAVTFGLPCIASDVGGNPEVIKDGFNGLLFPARDVNALRQAIIYFRDNEEERFRMATNAKESSVAYDLERNFPLIEEEIMKA